MTRRGIINVPLFSAPYTLPVSISGNAFRRLSWHPQLNGGLAVNANPTNIGLIATTFSAVPGPANVLSLEEFGTANSGVGGIFFGQSIDQGDVAITAGNIFYQIPMPPVAGVHNNLVSNTQFVSQPILSGQGLGTIIPYDNSARLEATQPFLGVSTQGGPFAGIVIVRTGTMLSGQYYLRASNTLQTQDMFDIGVSWATLQGNTTYYQCPDVSTGLVWGFFDPGNPASPVVPRQLAAYIPQPFSGSSRPPFSNYTPVFDDASLQAVWNGGGSGYTMDIWKGGWIIKLGTAGTGPTGQPEEIAVTDPGMHTYNLLRFTPQDNGAQTQFNHVTSFGWQVKIDPNGVLYFNSGAPADAASILYSYSPTTFFYPQFVYKPGFISLPCYTPCDAVTVETVNETY